MTRYHLSVLIPARNEYYYDIDLLHETVNNVLANTSDRTEIIVVLDGYWPLRPLPVNSRLRVIHHNKSIGQRAATNEAARVASGEYVMKLDAHTALDEQFDEKLLATFEPKWTVTPALYNLLVFTWKCKQCGWLKDQSPKPARCGKCNSRYLKQVKEWRPRDGSDGTDVDRKGGRRKAYLHSWRFDTKLEYQQWGEFANRPEQRTPIHDTMSLLGACWAMRRDRYWEIEPCDEKYGSWGQQGTEIACKTWLSGGELKCNTETWFAHFFRVGGIGFPYSDGGRKERAMARCREQWLENKWEKQIHPLYWLINKFSPVPDWSDENPVTQQVQVAANEFHRRQGQVLDAVVVHPKKISKCALYYTCGSHDQTLELAARSNLKRAVNGHELGCVALKRTDFGDWTLVLDREKSGGTMHYQILAGLERSTADYVFLCESDVMYHPSHFQFIPPRDDTVYYNVNVWRVRYSDGHAVRTANLQQVSGICANRKLLLEHYRRRVEIIARNNDQFDVKRMAYEPGTRGKFGDERIANWESEFPNLDITGHGQTLTTPHFSVESFRNKKFAAGWEETDGQITGWSLIYGRVREWLEELAECENPT
jgi:rubrerythrin